jgi:hypothetical protein
MQKYYVYQYIREDNSPYYIGKGKDDRAYVKHKRANGSDLRPKDRSKIQIIKHNLTEQEAHNLETELIAKYGKLTEGGLLVNITDGGVGGLTVDPESRKGSGNPMYGKSNPCSDQKRLDIIKTKNQDYLETYKKAVAMMDNGFSAVQTWKTLGISRTTVIRLKNRTHGFFKLFPELV